MTYKIWNNLIAGSWFSEKRAGKVTILAADEAFLERLAQKEPDKILLSKGQPAVEHFVASVRAIGRWRRCELERDSFPGTVGLVALAVLAATRMDHEEATSPRRGSLSFWKPFREIYGDISDANTSNQIPMSLKDIWIYLFTDLQAWANETKQGQLGIVRFPSTETFGSYDAHRNVRFPKSQALLSRGDLQRLTGWFQEKGIGPREQISFHWLQEQLRGDVASHPCFSKQARRVLGDESRFDSAVNQVLTYLANWNGAVWNRATGKPRASASQRMIFAIRQPSQSIIIGLQQFQNRKWSTIKKLDNFPPTTSSPW